MNDIYNDGTYLGANMTWHEEDSDWKAQHIIKLFERNSLLPSEVCEVGCGAGGILETLANHYEGASFLGYEISRQAYDICRRKSEANLSFKFGEVFADNRPEFEVAMAIDIFEHIDDYIGFLRKFREIAKYKVFHIPLDLTVITIMMPSRLKFRRDKFGHLHYFTKDTALRTLEATGYEVIDLFYTGVSIGRSGAGLMDKLLSLPRRMLFAINSDLAARTLGGYSLMVLTR